MTRKDYEKLAAIIYWATIDNGENDLLGKSTLVSQLQRELKQDGRGFTAARFREACDGTPFPESLRA